MAGRTLIALFQSVDIICMEAGYSLANSGTVRGFSSFWQFVFGPVQKLFVNLLEPLGDRGLA